MKKGGQYEGLLKCKEEGLIDNIVVSSHMPGEDIENLMKNGEFEAVLMGINILNFMYRWQGVEAALDSTLRSRSISFCRDGLCRRCRPHMMPRPF